MPDGSYTLYYMGDPAMPWTAYCRDMASAPLEYLTLPSAATNFAQYTAGGQYATGTSVLTSYRRVRFVVDVGMVDISDRTFATSTGELQEEGTHSATVTSMPYGVAASCDDTASGSAMIDLTGTAFAVTSGQFMPGGYLGTGAATYSSGNHVVSITGGGYCGWDGPGTLADPVSNSGGAQLVLEYSP